MTTEERVSRLENAFVTITEVQRGLEERFDTHEKWINELGETQARLTDAQARLTDAQANSEAKIAALADAQANSEAKIAALVDAQIHTEEAITGLTRRLDALIERLDRDGEK